MFQFEIGRGTCGVRAKSDEGGKQQLKKIHIVLTLFFAQECSTGPWLYYKVMHTSYP